MLKEALVIVNAFFGSGHMAAHSDPPKDYKFVGHPQHDNKLEVALADIWENKKGALKRDTTLFKLYRDMVQYLVAGKVVWSIIDPVLLSSTVIDNFTYLIP